MKTFFVIAFRNIIRNSHRSLTTIFAIVFGLAAIIFIQGFIGGINEQMIENSTSYFSGDIQINSKRFFEDKDLDNVLPQPKKVEKVLKNIKEVKSFSPRIETFALISSKEKSKGIALIGISPKKEDKVTSLYKTIKKGKFLEEGDNSSIVLGDASAKALNVSVGDKVVILSQAADGSIAAEKYKVKGIFDTGNDTIDAIYAFLTLPAMQELFVLPNDIHSYVIKLRNRKNLPAVVNTLKQKLKGNYEINSWQKMLPSVVQAVAFHNAAGYIILIIVFLVVSIGILNTILMSVLERTREFGIMRALGTKKRQVVLTVVYESFLLGTIGIILGIILGVSINLYFGRVGLNLSNYAAAMETMPGLTGFVYPTINVSTILFSSVFVFLISILASLYPAVKASKLEPVEAISERGSSQKIFKVKFNIFSRFNFQFIKTEFIFLKIAIRNIIRNPRRTFITLIAISFGLGSIIFLWAFDTGFNKQLIKFTTGYLTGDIQITLPKFRSDLSPNLNFNPKRTEEIIKNDKDVSNFSERIETQVLVSSAEKSTGIILLGVDAKNEPKVTFLNKAVRKGRFIKNNELHSIVLGKKVVEKLKVSLGEKVVVTAQSKDGSLTNSAYRIVGIIDTGIETFDKGIGVTSLNSAKNLIGTKENISSIILNLKNQKKLDEVASSLQKKLGKNYEVSTWKEIMPIIVQMIGISYVFLYIILIVIFVVVSVGIMNTILMSIRERTREFGVIMALGTKKKEVIKLIIYESALLGLLGIILGNILGVLVTLYFGKTGIDFSSFSEALKFIPGAATLVFPQIIPLDLLIFSAILFPFIVLFCLYPAFKTSNLEPVDAIRFI